MTDEKKFLEKFINASRDALKEINERLILLESSPGDAEALDSLFYSIHTLKGNSSFLGFKSLIAAAHAAEEVLSGARSGESAVSPDGIDALWKGYGCMNEIIERAASGAEERELGGSRSGTMPDAAPPGTGEDGGAGVMRFSGGGDITRQAAKVRECFEKFRAGRSDGNGEFVRVMEEIESAFKPGSAEAALAGGIKNEFEAMVEDTGLPGEGLLKILEEDFEKLHESALKDVPAPTLRVEEEKIDEILSSVRKMDEVKTAFNAMRDRMVAEGIGLPDGMVLEFQKILNNFTSISRDMLQKLFSMKVSSPRLLLEKTRDLIGALAGNSTKKIRIEIGAGDVFIARSKLEMLEPVLVHIVRNCIDHGIEEPEERLNNSKPEEGLITISASNTAGGARITVSDDGRGVDAAAVKESAFRERKITSGEAEKMSSARAFELIFMPGVSSARAATEFSGRGMGLGAACELVRKAGGGIRIHSEPGRGTTVELDLPGAEM